MPLNYGKKMSLRPNYIQFKEVKILKTHLQPRQERHNPNAKENPQMIPQQGFSRQLQFLDVS